MPYTRRTKWNVFGVESIQRTSSIGMREAIHRRCAKVFLLAFQFGTPFIIVVWYEFLCLFQLLFCWFYLVERSKVYFRVLYQPEHWTELGKMANNFIEHLLIPRDFNRFILWNWYTKTTFWTYLQYNLLHFSLSLCVCGCKTQWI